MPPEEDEEISGSLCLIFDLQYKLEDFRFQNYSSLRNSGVLSVSLYFFLKFGRMFIPD
jgi:hypothetical protein